jgi:cardiolipin synthase (CMP-forming)
MRLTAADWITTSRIALAPIVVYLFAMGHDGAALIIFAVAGATDLIDGTVARLYGQSSIGGALLDPVADKLLIQSCFISLGITGVLPWWFVALAFARDIMIVSGITYLEIRKVPLPYRAAISSKIATVCQLGVAMGGLAEHMRPGFLLMSVPLSQLLLWLIVVTAIFIVVSGVNYVVIGVGILRAARAAGPAGGRERP